MVRQPPAEWCYFDSSVNDLFLLFKGDDFRGFEAERNGSKGPVWSRQNPSKGKEKYITAPHEVFVVIYKQHIRLD